MNLDKILTSMIQYRKIVLGVTVAILAASFGAGYIYQQNQNKNNEAQVLFDTAWQQVVAVSEDIRRQPGSQYTVDNPVAAQAKSLYNEGLQSLDVVISDYPDTISGARAAILYLMVKDVPYLNALVDDTNLLTRMQNASYLDGVQDNNKKFWDVLLDVSFASKAEQTLDTANAITYYQSALKKDKQKYISDYILFSLARIYENVNNNEDAKKYYQQLVDEYQDSVWVNVAQAKIYLLSQ